ncbi:uncharacterized protein LOC115919185 [Strongylocentrotus purpuratus]|nr:uncharacterized protein LOC115919185 [Strongylocentrotus purpuratus]
MFKKQLDKHEQQLKGGLSEPNVSLPDRQAYAEATILAFTAEHSLPFSIVNDLIHLNQELAKDKQVLENLSMDRTTASYKMTHGLSKTFHEELIEDLKSSHFSLNIDECTSETNQRVVTVLVSYFSEKENKVVTKHLSSFKVVTVNSETLYNHLVALFDKYSLKWENLVSILMDSCAVMRGSKSGLETRIRSKKAPQLLDIDGDSCHHAHNAAKAFCHGFDNYIEGLLNDIYTDFKWSSDQKEVLRFICDALGIKATIPERYVPHRWLSVYDVCVDTSRLLDALILFYYPFLSGSDSSTYLPVVDSMYQKHSISESVKKEICKHQSKMSNKTKTMTQAGKDRKKRIVKKLFHTPSKTKVLLHIYTSILPMLKKYVLYFQSVTPLVHKLNDKQQDLLKDFLVCFIKPEILNTQALHKVNVSEENILPDNAVFLVRYIKENLQGPAASELVNKLKTAYLKCGQTLQRKMPVNNKLLRCASAIDPACRGHTITLQRLLQLPQLVAFALKDVQTHEYEKEARQYNTDKEIVNTEERIDIFWSSLREKYPVMTRVALALVSCFHGPQVESSFSIMGNVLNTERPNLHIETFSSIQTVKYELTASGKSGIRYFRRKNYLKDQVNPKLCKNMRSAYKSYVQEKEHKSGMSQTVPRKSACPSKKQTKEKAIEDADKARVEHTHKLMKKVEKRKSEMHELPSSSKKVLKKK